MLNIEVTALYQGRQIKGTMIQISTAGEHAIIKTDYRAFVKVELNSITELEAETND